MGQGMGMGTEVGQGHKGEKEHLGRNTQHYRDRATEVGQRQDRAWGQGWDLQDFLLPRDLLRSLLAQGRGLAL